MKCAHAKSLFSPYLDGAVSGTEMHGLSQHLESCAACREEYSSLHQVAQLMNVVGRKKAPSDLNLQLRVAISREIARSRQPYLAGILVRFENTINAFMFPVTAGLASAVVIFGLLMGIFALPSPLQANNDDVPLMLYSAPQLQQSAFGTTLDSINDDSLVIEAYVDSRGRVQDYRVLSHPEETTTLSPEVKNMLIFTTFRPALSMGRPTAGRAVLSFSNIKVKG